MMVDGFNLLSCYVICRLVCDNDVQVM